MTKQQVVELRIQALQMALARGAMCGTKEEIVEAAEVFLAFLLSDASEG